MSGQRRVLREGNRKLSSRSSELNFGSIARVLLTFAAIVAAWKFPDLTLLYVAGP
jgi:hypothetical protein